MKSRHMIRIASYLYLEKDRKVLLLRRKNTGYMDGMYTLVSGHVDPGESFSESMIREAFEEAHIKVKARDLVPLHVTHRAKDNYVDVYFTAKEWDGEIDNREPDKCDDLSWFSLDNLPGTIIPHVRFVIDKIKEKEFYSEFFTKSI